MEEPGADGRQNLPTNCQAQDISTYRFPLMRATWRQTVHALKEEKPMHGKRPEIAGCGVTAHVMLLTDMPIASRAAGIISRMASRWMPM